MEENIRNNEENKPSASDNFQFRTDNSDGTIVTDNLITDAQLNRSKWILISAPLVAASVFIGFIYYSQTKTVAEDKSVTIAPSENTEVVYTETESEVGEIVLTEKAADIAQADSEPDKTYETNNIEAKSTDTSSEELIVVEYDDPDDTASMYQLREFVDKTYDLVVKYPYDFLVSRDSSGTGCNHEYIEKLVAEYEHPITCREAGEAISFTAPDKYEVTSYCVDSSGFSGLVINTDPRSGVLCKDVFQEMQPFDPNNPDLSRIASFQLPEFSKVFTVEERYAAEYEKLKLYYSSVYGEKTYSNDQFGYSFDFPSMYVAGVESGETKDANLARKVDIRSVAPWLPSLSMEIEVFSGEKELSIAEIEQTKELEKISRLGDSLFVTPKSSRSHSSPNDKLNSTSMLSSSILWSADGMTVPLIISIRSLYKTYDEVDFAYTYKYHEFIERIISDSLEVDQELLKSSQ